MEGIKLLVCCHKADEHIRNYSPYVPIHVGKALHPDLNLGFITDNTGDNISEKNPYYCELTALYWGWKNLKDVKYLGLCHYRRYFDMDVDFKKVDKILSKYDMIVIKNEKTLSKRERPEHVIHVTSQEDYYIYLDTMLSMHPEYKDKIIDYFYNSRFSHPFNMFIANKTLYDKYCEFMFPVFFEIEKKLKKTDYTRQKRRMGYLGEFTLSVFIHCMGLKVYEVPQVSFSSDDIRNNSYVYRVGRSLINGLIRFLYNMKELKKTNLTIPESVKVGLINDGVKLEFFK